MIPRRIHLFWMGEASVLEDSLGRWRAIHPDWSVIGWTPERLANIVPAALASAAEVEPADLSRHVGNVVRWHLLETWGGIWVDVDTKPLASLEPLLGPRPFSAAAGPMPTPFVCGGPQGHRLWATALATSLDHPRGTSPDASGGRMLARIIEDNEIALYPMAWFTEVDAAGRTLRSRGPRYSTHEWATSTTRNRRPKEPADGHTTRHARR